MRGARCARGAGCDAVHEPVGGPERAARRYRRVQPSCAWIRLIQLPAQMASRTDDPKQ